MKLKFKKISSAPFLLFLGICFLFVPYLFLKGTVLFKNGNYLMLIWIELLILFSIFFLWYKIYYEIIFAKIENGILYYKHLFFIKKSIRIDNIKGFKIGNEDYDFLVLYDKNDKKLFVVRMDFYSNYYDFIDELKAKEIGIYYTLDQRIIRKIFKRNG